MKIRIFAMLLCLMLLLPAGAMAATDYGLTVCGTQVTSDALSDESGSPSELVSGSWSYAPDSNTVTLYNVLFEDSGKNAIYTNSAATGPFLNILCLGQNKLDTDTACAIAVDVDALNLRGYNMSTLEALAEIDATLRAQMYISDLALSTQSLRAASIMLSNSSLDVQSASSDKAAVRGNLVVTQGSAVRINAPYGLQGDLTVMGDGTVEISSSISAIPDGTVTYGDNMLIIVSENADGSNPAIYTPEDLATYKYLRIQPRTLSIVTQPADQYAAPGESATFSVEAKGDGLTYQWFMGWSDRWLHQEGATGASFTVEPLLSAHDGFQFYCAVTDKYGDTVQSEVATLHVSPEIPATGDNSQPTLYLALVMASALGIVILQKKRNLAR